jgi:putative toxin-antitoxin system antitoxin component (TIGR02293 family)
MEKPAPRYARSLASQSRVPLKIAEPLSIAQVRAGLPIGALDAFARDLNVERAHLADLLGITLRTLQRKRESAQCLGPVASDRLARMRRIQGLAQQVFGEPEKAAGWLTTPSRALGGEVPLFLLDTDLGTERVQQELRQIESGMPL